MGVESQPWRKTIIFTRASINTGLHGAEIADNDFQKAEDWVFDNGVMEKGPSKTQIGTAPEAYPVYGMWRSCDKDGNKTILAHISNKLYNWVAGPSWVSVYTGLSAYRPSFIDTDKKTFVTNGYQDVLEYSPKDYSVIKAGVEPLRYYKKVAYFETDEQDDFEAGATFSNVFYVPTERTGDSTYSLSLSATATNTTTKYRSTGGNYTAYDNGVAIGDDDLFCMSILHTTIGNVSSISIVARTTAGAGTYTLTIDGSELDPVKRLDNQWTHIAVKRSRFVGAGTPDWSAIDRWTFGVTATASGTAQVYLDNCYFKNPLIEATQYKKFINNFEDGTGNYTTASVTLANEPRKGGEGKVKEGTQSLKCTVSAGATGELYKTVALDLSQYADGFSTQTSDMINLDAFVSNTSRLTSITVRLYSDVSGSPKYFQAAFTVAGGDFRKTTTGAWSQLQKAKGSWTDVGTANWAGIIRVWYQIVNAGGGSVDVYLDNNCIQENALLRTIRDMESDETWTFGPTTGGGNSSNPKYVSEGSQSIYLTVPKKQTYTATSAVAVNLNQFSGGESSSSDDLICFWMYWNRYKTIQSIKVQFDVNASDFATDYYEYEMTPAELAQRLNMEGASDSKLNNKALDVEIAKSDFTRIGTGANTWANVVSVRFVVQSVEKNYFPVTVYFDNLTMRRRKGITGIFQWCCVPYRSDGTPGAPSEWSEPYTFGGTKALLGNLPISPDTNIGYREFYRKGGTLGTDARLDFTIFDNATPTYWSDLPDENLGKLLDLTWVPEGTIRLPRCAKWGPKFMGCYTMYGDPNSPSTLYYSKPGAIHAWSEIQIVEFDGEILDVFLMDNMLFVITENEMARFSVPLSLAQPEDIQGLEYGIIPLNANCACDTDEGGRIIVADDGVYLFDGNGFRLISEAIKNYFDDSAYVFSTFNVFYNKRHIYLHVQTVPVGESSTKTLLVCYVPNDDSKKIGLTWTTSNQYVYSFAAYDAQGDGNKMLVGTSDGKVYTWGSGYVTNSEAITKDFGAVGEDGSYDPFAEIEVHEIWVKARSSASGGSIDLTLRINEANTAIVKTAPEDGTDLTSKYVNYPFMVQGVEEGFKGNKIGLKINSTDATHCAIEAIMLKGVVTPLPLARES